MYREISMEVLFTISNRKLSLNPCIYAWVWCDPNSSWSHGSRWFRMCIATWTISFFIGVTWGHLGSLGVTWGHLYVAIIIGAMLLQNSLEVSPMNWVPTKLIIIAFFTGSLSVWIDVLCVYMYVCTWLRNCMYVCAIYSFPARFNFCMIKCQFCDFCYLCLIKCQATLDKPGKDSSTLWG